MDRATTIKVFTDHLKKSEPFSFLKVGDDCVFCMRGQVGSNAELHPYSETLGKHLREAKEYLLQQKNAYVAEWNQPLAYFDALLLHEDQFLTPDLKEFYQLLKDDPRPKYYFARERMKDAAKVFRMNFIEVPFPDSYSHIEEVKRQVKEIAQPGAILLFSCGMLAKTMIYEAHKICNDMTIIDLGSAFDPLFVGSTRSNDPDQHLRVKEYYADILQD